MNDTRDTNDDDASQEAPTLDFFYDIVCPYAYLASMEVETLAGRFGAKVRWRPILLGGLLRTVGAPDDPNLVMNEAKARLQRLDRKRTAERIGVPVFEPKGHPLRTVDAMRLCLAAAPGRPRAALSHDLFVSYWQRRHDVTDPQVLAAIAKRNGLPADAHTDPALKDGLRQATAEAAAAGAFGVPTFILNGELFWGQDRLPLVEAKLRALAKKNTRLDPPIRLRFFHDFSSPFSYLAATQIDTMAEAYGVTVEWIPILLGALFRDVGTTDVPLLAMNEAKQAYVRRDLSDWAQWWGVPFRFPQHFPMRSVLPLRVALAEPRTTPTIYRAAWAEDRPVDTPEALGPILEEAGFPAQELLARAVEPANKAQLRTNTESARALNLFGVPSMVVERGGRRVTLWGQDRLPMLESIFRGWWPHADDHDHV